MIHTDTEPVRLSDVTPPELAPARRYTPPAPPTAEELANQRAMHETAYAIALEHGFSPDRVYHALAGGVPASDIAAIIAAMTAEWEHEAEEARAANRVRITADTDNRIPPRFARATADHPDVLAWVGTLVRLARREARSPGFDHLRTGPSLLLAGPVGTGKTYQAYGVLRALANEAVSTAWEFTTIADLYGALRPRQGADTETEFRRIMGARLLVVDDLGASKDSEWTEEVNYRLTDHRYKHELPTLFTSNVPPRELPARLGQRVASRLTEMTTTVTITGHDRRIHQNAA